jgi:hypothetical protein
VGGRDEPVDGVEDAHAFVELGAGVEAAVDRGAVPREGGLGGALRVERPRRRGARELLRLLEALLDALVALAADGVEEGAAR